MTSWKLHESNCQHNQYIVASSKRMRITQYLTYTIIKWNILFKYYHFPVTIVFKQSRESQWQTLFRFLSALNVFGCIVFLIWGSGEIQDWARLTSEEDDLTETSSKVTASYKPYRVQVSPRRATQFWSIPPLRIFFQSMLFSTNK